MRGAALTFGKEMNDMRLYAIFHRNFDEQKKNYELQNLIAEHFDTVSCEYDEGLAFIRSEADSDEILEKIADHTSLELGDTVYVMELTGNFSANGGTKAIRALKQAGEELRK